jgi:hypothetical protein
MSWQSRLSEDQTRQMIDRIIEIGEQALDDQTIADLKDALSPQMKQLV